MVEHEQCVKTEFNLKDNFNQLFIEDTFDDDSSVARLSSKTMDKLQLFCGDTVKLKGKKRRETICIVLSDDTCQDDHIRVNRVIQNNLQVHSGDIISTEGCPSVKHGRCIRVLLFDDTVKESVNSLIEEYLQPYFRDNFRPVYIGDTFIVHVGMHAIEFKVINTEPSPYCIVVPETVIYCDDDAIKREIEKTLVNEIDFDDIGGLDDVKQILKNFIQHPIEHQEKYHKFGLAPSRGMLLYGPPGCGKTMLVKALANECNVNFISMKSSELLIMPLDNIEDNVRKIFDQARQNAICILLIDDLDCIFKFCDNDSNDKSVLANRLINQIITEIDSTNVKSKIFIIGVTNRPKLIDRTILRPGRLDQAVYIPLPDQKSREAIFKITLQKCHIAEDIDLSYFAKLLNGSSGADIVDFCQRAYKVAIQELIEKEQEIEQASPNMDLKVQIRRNHFEKAVNTYPRCFPCCNYNIDEYEMFRKTLLHSSASSDSSFYIPVNAWNMNEYDSIKEVSATYTDDDDLYT